MTIQLPADIEVMIRRQVNGGFYASADDVIAAAVRLLDEHDRQLAWMRAKLQSGIDQLDRGEGVFFTPEWSAERLRVLRDRVAAGETPHPDVCP